MEDDVELGSGSGSEAAVVADEWPSTWPRLRDGSII